MSIPVGTVRLGLDGKAWIVIRDEKGISRWREYTRTEAAIVIQRKALAYIYHPKNIDWIMSRLPSDSSWK